jgi:hypothetical protein
MELPETTLKENRKHQVLDACDRFGFDMIPLSRQSFSLGPNLRSVVAGLIALLIPIVAVVGLQQPRADSIRLIKEDNPAKLEKELNEASADGYRVSRADSARILSAAANLFLSGGHEDTSGAAVVMEKTPSASGHYEYAVVRLFVRASSWERDINKTASQGFRVIPNYGTLAMRHGFVLGTAQSLIAIMEKAPGDSEIRKYVVVEARQIGNFERDVNQRFTDGYAVMYIGRFYALHVALMEKSSDAPVEEQLLTAKTDDELEAKIRANATEHFCIAYTESTLDDAAHGDRLAYLRKCDAAPEYLFIENDHKARPEFDKAVADGYRFAPAGVFGKAITLVRAPTGERYEYRFAKNRTDADKARQDGYSDLPLSYPVWGGSLLERSVSVPQAP